MFQLDTNHPGATLLWQHRGKVLSNTSTALIQGSNVFSGLTSGDLVCLDARTGKQRWSTNSITNPGNGSSIHLVPTSKGMFLYTDKGELISVRLSSEGCEELSRVRLVEPVYSFGGKKVAWVPPAFSNGCLFVRTDDQLACFSFRE